jgi:hypothetical protein
MRRKNDANKEELEGVAQRLRNERPEASPLQLDQIKMSAMSRAKAGTRRRSAGARRLATAGLTIGLLAAGTGGVIAGGDGGHHSGGSTSASATQYGTECSIINGSGNVGEGNGANSENYACNENSFNNITITNTTTNEGGTVTNNYFSTTVSATPAASSGVLAAKTTKPALSLRDIKIHLKLSRKTHLKRVTLKLNGKTFKVLKGSAASKNIKLTNLPCTSGVTTITVVAVTSTGKTITESHTFHLCQG